MSTPPLTFLLRRCKWRDTKIDYKSMSSYQEVATEVLESMKEGRRALPMRVSLFQPSLFGPIPNSYLEHVLKRYVQGQGYQGAHPFLKAPKGPKTGYMYAKDLTPAFRKFLVNKLYWINLITATNRKKIFDMCETMESFSDLRSLLISVEMRMNSIILSTPNLQYEEADQINAMLVNNTLNFPDYHKKLKSQCKEILKCLRTTGEVPRLRREFSWVARRLKVIKSLRLPDEDLRQTLYSTLLQSRSSGLPSNDVIRESKLKWMEAVNLEPPLGDIPDSSELESYLRKRCKTRKVLHGFSRVSLGFTGCFESSRMKGGKTGEARMRITENESVQRIDLETGNVTDDIIYSRDQAGEFLLHSSLHKFIEDEQPLLRVRVSTIDEVGSKARIITVPSFDHNIILSSWAHITYDYLSTTQEAYSGLKSSNHGWSLCLDLSPSNPNLHWLFEGKEVISSFNSDLESATDLALHQAIAEVMDALNRILLFPRWYSEVVKKLLSSPRTYMIEIDDMVVRGTTKRGCFMGDSGAKTILTAAGLNALCAMKGPRVSRIVGDDQATISYHRNMKHNENVYRTRMEAWGFRLSEPDTYISEYCFFTEECFRIETNPTLSLETYLSGRRGRINYLDYPRVRLLSDVSSNVRGFSNTMVGKITLMARHMEYSEGNSVVHGLMHLASWIQDLCCSLLYKPEFVYFPRFLVSTGKPILFGHDENFVDFIKTQKSGRLLGNYMDLMWRATDTQVGGQTAIISQFDHRSTNFLRIVEEQTRLPQEIEEFKLMDTLNQRGIVPFIIGRLGHKLISETEIKMKINEMEFLFDEKVPLRSTVSTLSERKRVFSEETLRLFITKWRKNSILLKFKYHERFYEREKVEDFLNSKHPLRVQIPLGISTSDEDLTEKDMLLLERDRDTEILWEWVLSNPSDLSSIPRTLIRDDLPLLRNNPALLTASRILIVSDDIKLVQQLSTLRSFNWRKSLETYRCSVKNWVQSDLTAGTHFDSATEVVIDEGSLDGFIDNVKDDSELDPIRVGIELDMIKLIRPTQSHKIQEVSEYDDMIAILKIPETEWISNSEKLISSHP